MQVRRSIALMATAALLLSACGDEKKEEKLTFQGTAVKDAAGSLKTFEQNWRAHMAQLETPVRIADGARCYYQVVDREITVKLLCGPFRAASSKAAAWSSTGLFGYPPSDGTTMLGFEDMEGVNWDDEAAPLPNAVAMTASGDRADLNQALDEPDAPELKTGTAVTVDATGGFSTDGVTGSAYAIDGGTWQLRAPSTPPGRYAGQGKERRQAPKGGSLILLSMEHIGRAWTSEKNDARLAESKTTISLQAGGKTIALPKPANANFNQTWLVSVPGSGADAKVVLTADGGSQTLHLSDGKLEGATAGWTPGKSAGEALPLANARSCERAARSSEPESGFSTDVVIECDVEWTVAPYLAGHGWAPPGTQWVVASIKPSTSFVGHYSKNSFRSSYKTAVALTDVRLDAAKPAKPLAVRKTSHAYGGDPYMVTDAVFQLKYGASPLKMTLVGDATGELESAFGSEDAPKSWSRKGLSGKVTD